MASQATFSDTGTSGTDPFMKGAVHGNGGDEAFQDNLKRNPQKGEIKLFTNQIKIGTWNVRPMNRAGKLENLKIEMERENIDILGLCETRWKEVGDFQNGETRIIYSGGKEHRNGVGLVLNKKTRNSVSRIVLKNERIMMIKLSADPVDVVIIQVYMPTSTHNHDEIESMYDQIEELIDEEKGNTHLIIMGDWNAVVGETKEDKIAGNFGIGKRERKRRKTY